MRKLCLNRLLMTRAVFIVFLIYFMLNSCMFNANNSSQSTNSTAPCTYIKMTPAGQFWQDPNQVSSNLYKSERLVVKGCAYLDTVNSQGTALFKLGNLKNVAESRIRLAEVCSNLAGGTWRPNSRMREVFKLALDSLDAMTKDSEAYYAFSVYSLAYRILRTDRYKDSTLRSLVLESAYRDLFDYPPGVVCALKEHTLLLDSDKLYSVVNDDLCDYIFGWQSLMHNLLADPIGVYGE